MSVNKNKSSISNIPKIIHQIWIGTKPRPSKFMDTWKNMNPDFEYIYWSEDEIIKRGLKLECLKQVDLIEEINGKADIIRWEILYHYGGVFIDADSICIEPIDNYLMNKKAFSGYENEIKRKDLVATGTMGFPKNHPLCRAAIDFVLNNPTDQKTTGQMAWLNVGPGLLTKLLNTGNYNDVHVFPSYTFLPFHYTGLQYKGHSKVYAYQEWGSTKQNYEIMNSIDLPEILKEPNPYQFISILIASYNTKFKYICDCLESIKNQEGYFGIELVWVNDGSNELNTRLLEQALESFKETTRFCKVVYHKMDKNMGLSYCLNRGLHLCTNEFVFRMDSDDIMLPIRMQKQLDFILNKSDCVLCGSNVQFIKMNEKNEMTIGSATTHPLRLTLEEYKLSRSNWFMNHPTFCFRKSAILEVGNYNDEERKPFEDFELELKILKKYGVIYNLEESLLLYRLHPDQITFNGKSNTPTIVKERNELIDRIIFS
jgi:mannosyltransferase OCH1-like enzyme